MATLGDAIASALEAPSSAMAYDVIHSCLREHEADKDLVAQLIELLLDHGVGLGGRGQRFSRVGALLRWLLVHPAFGDPAQEALVHVFTGQSKRLQLAASRALHAGGFTHSPDGALTWSPADLTTLFQVLCHCACGGPECVDAKQQPERCPTNLTVAAADAAIGCLAHVCVLLRAADPATGTKWAAVLRCCAGGAQRLLTRLQCWRQEQLAFVAAIDELQCALALSIASDHRAESTASVPSSAVGTGHDQLLQVTEALADPSLADEYAQLRDVCSLWLSCAPMLLSSARACKRHDVSARMERYLEKLCDEPIAAPSEALCCLALMLEVAGAGVRAWALHRLAARLYPRLRPRCTSCAEAALPLALMHMLGPAMQHHGHSVAELLQPTLDVLQATDAAPPIVARLVAIAALDHPASALPEVCTKVLSAVSTQRANALAILVLVARERDIATLLARPVLIQLTNALILRLSDADTRVREHATALLVRFDLHVTLPCLADAAASVVPPPSSVEEVMLSTLQAAPDASTTVAALIDALRDLNSPPHDASAVAQTPGLIGQSAGAPTAEASNDDACSTLGDKVTGKSSMEAESAQRLLRVTEAWACTCHGDTWAQILRTACTKFFSASQDLCSLHVMKRLLTCDGGAAFHPVVVQASVDRLRAVPSAQLSEESGAAVRTPYGRLRPLLLLQMLPDSSWARLASGADTADGVATTVRYDTVNASDACVDELMQCLLNEAELQQVRKVAASLLAQLPPVRIMAQMVPYLRQLASAPAVRCQEPMCGLALYYMGCAATLHRWVAWQVASDSVAALLFDVVGASPVSGDALGRLQRGSIDCLARAISTLVSSSEEPRQISTALETLTARGALLSRILSLVDVPSSAVHALAILTLATRMLHARGGGVLASQLFACVLPALLSSSVQGQHVTQALFDLSFHAQPLTGHLVGVLLPRVQVDARSHLAGTRVAALKLLGVLMASMALLSDDECGALAASPPAESGGDDAHKGAVMQMLHTLSCLAHDPASDVRSLAEHLQRTCLGTA